MPPQKTLQAFLATARAALTAPPSKRPVPLTFVVGNESADLDSLCSALLLAYLRTHAPPHVLHIPLCHLPRDDLSLRPEFAAVLRRAAVAPDDVLTLTELPAATTTTSTTTAGGDGLKPEDTRWLLVDHNVMTGALGRRYAGRVVGCIDHHDDEGRLPPDADPRVVEKCGSCMSLVVEHCGAAWEGLAKQGAEGGGGSKEALRINAQLAYIALAPILIDTANLGNPDKTTAHDERAVGIAEGHIRAAEESGGGDGGGGDEYDRAKFFAEVAALKEDVSYMSFRDIFRKDYKEWEEGDGEGKGKGKLRLGTSSVSCAFAALVRKAGSERQFARELERWCEERELDVAAVLTTSKEGGSFTRELLVWARTGPEVVGAAKKFAESDGKEKLGLGVWGDGKLDLEDGEGSWRRCWTQAKVEHSRKQIAPMLREALKGVVKE